MKILQEPISDKHLNAMFFDGVVAEYNKDNKLYTLQTFATGEIMYRGNYLTDVQIVELGKQGLINDNDLDDACDNNSDTIDIVVDKFFAIYCDGMLIDKYTGIGDSDYRESLKWFVDVLGILNIEYCAMVGLLYINGVPFTKQSLRLVYDVMIYSLKNKRQFDYGITITDNVNESKVTLNKENIQQLIDAAIKYNEKVADDVDFN